MNEATSKRSLNLVLFFIGPFIYSIQFAAREEDENSWFNKRPALFVTEAKEYIARISMSLLPIHAILII